MAALHRLDRRNLILRGKRGLVFDPAQRWLEEARRLRTMRKVRSRLRLGQPVMLITPRWSQAHRFLDDVASDLALGTPSIEARVLPLTALQGRPVNQAWSWLTQALTDFANIQVQGPVWQAVSRLGFRHVLGELFRRAEDGAPRVLLMYGVEHVQFDALRDLLASLEDHFASTGRDRRFNVLLATSVDAAHVDLFGAERIGLPDFEGVEAVEALAEHVGAVEPSRLRAVAGLLGGVPALIDALGARGPNTVQQASASRDALWHQLGQVGSEIRAALDIVHGDDLLARRLDQLAREGTLPEDPERDFQLLRAGLVRTIAGNGSRYTAIRAPLITELALTPA